MSAQISEPPMSDETDELAGIRFPDPYRRLETDDGAVQRWQSEQAEAAMAFVHDWPHYDQLRESVDKYVLSWFGSVPRSVGGRWFRKVIEDDGRHECVVVADEPFGSGRVAFDPRTEDADSPPMIVWFSPSPNGRTLAVGVCDDGSEHNTIRLVDVDAGAALSDPPTEVLRDGATGGVQWLADSQGFFFVGTAGQRTDTVHQVWLHRRDPEPTTTRVEVPWLPDDDYRMVVVSADGRHAVAVQRIGNPVPVAVARLDSAAELRWQPFVTEIAGALAGYLLGDEWVAVTDVDAPRGRVVSVALSSATPNDPASWTVLVPESDAVVRMLAPVGDHLYLEELVDTYAQVRIVDRAGRVHGKVPLPGKGTLEVATFPLQAMALGAGTDEYVFGFTTLLHSSGVYRYRFGATALEVLQEPRVRLENAEVEDRWATSSDGTRIPYHLVSRRDAGPEGPRPALIYAYGGFNVPWSPAFPGAMAAFVEAGGVFVHAHLRGGGEFGGDWWRGGSLKTKQNTFDDLYAVAEDLVATGLTTTDQLAVTGASAGGLLCGVAVTQRPDLWAAVIPRIPLLDLIGACREGYGQWVVQLEFGDPHDPQDVRRIATYSPYQLVVDGARYPAVFVDAGDSDPRCPPWHARKFAARLQAATRGDNPVLLRVWPDVGHGWATDREITVDQETAWLAFTMKVLGLALPVQGEALG
jgi:prolyl oligopeptidase